ncbi:hypothetical protein J1605_013954 [Eschrichtius robustus]|uniref:Speriolin C-terminal domain-containing protein n=1 Tax=Eschrichtius robustus TaxID=9764 RepID=A0AB34GEJ4_ESCRO|nr:hypothetical protein J1605_013954 [Eschrichtius robustus]
MSEQAVPASLAGWEPAWWTSRELREEGEQGQIRALRASLKPSDHKLDEELCQTLTQRYTSIMNRLQSLGYNGRVHPALTEQLVNAYGILRERPELAASEGGSYTVDFLQRVLVETVHPSMLTDALLLLSCLSQLAHDDGKPMFICSRARTNESTRTLEASESSERLATKSPARHAIPARLAPDALRPTALALPAPCAARSPRPGPRATFPGLLGPGPAAGLLGAGRTPKRPDLAERRSGRRSGSAAAAASCRPASAAAGPAALAAAASLAPSLLLPAPSAVRGGAPPTPWRPPTEPARSFSFFSANLCLIPDGLARFSNLPHSQRRAETVGAVLLAGLRHSPYGATGCSSTVQGMPCGVLIGAMPASLDFTCLQELFDLRAERRLLSRLAPNLGPVSYDVGTFGLQPRLHLKLLGSGLLLASRYPLLRAALQSFLTHLGIPDGRRIVGFLHCMHLHAPSKDGLLRRKQLTLLLDWAERSEVESRQSNEAVAFSVRLDHAQEPAHQLFSRFRDPCRLGTRRGTRLSISNRRHSVAYSAEMLRGVATWGPGNAQKEGCPDLADAATLLRALEQGEGRRRRLDYVTYRGGPGGILSPGKVEQPS